MEQHQKINLYLDRDDAGMKNRQTALKWDIKYIDKSHLYKNHRDLNDYWFIEIIKLNNARD